MNEVTISVRAMVDELNKSGIYDEDMFIDNEQAIEITDENTLLIVVDVNHANYTECEQLLSQTKTTVILDHHRKNKDMIKNPANRFVFSFIGVSNFIPVAEKSGSWCLDIGEGIPYSAVRPQGILPGVKNVMGIRPMDIIFDDESPVRGTIEQSVFLGSLFNYFVRVGDQELRVQRSTLDSLDGREYAEGQEVGLRFLNEKYYDAEEESV